MKKPPEPREDDETPEGGVSFVPGSETPLATPAQYAESITLHGRRRREFSADLAALAVQARMGGADIAKADRGEPDDAEEHDLLPDSDPEFVWERLRDAAAEGARATLVARHGGPRFVVHGTRGRGRTRTVAVVGETGQALELSLSDILPWFATLRIGRRG